MTTRPAESRRNPTISVASPGTVQSQSATPASTSGRWKKPVTILLALLSICSAGFGLGWLVRFPERGLVLDDEAFYILAAQPENAAAAYNGMSGWYLGRLMSVTGLTVPGLRVAGVLALVALGVHLGLQTERLVASRAVLSCWDSTTIVTGIASSSLLYYCFHFPRTPGYNWLAAAGLTLLTAGLIRIAVEIRTGSRVLPGTASIAAGLYICAIGKALSALIAAVLVGMILAWPLRATWRGTWKRLGLVAAWAPPAIVMHHLFILDLWTSFNALQRAATHLAAVDPAHYTVEGALLASAIAVAWAFRQVLGPLYLTPLLGLLERVPRARTTVRTWVLIAVPVFAMHRIVTSARLDYFDIVVASGLPVVGALLTTYVCRASEGRRPDRNLILSVGLALQLPIYAFGSNVGVTLFYPGLTSILLVAAIIALPLVGERLRRTCVVWSAIAALMVTPSLFLASQTEWMSEDGYASESHTVVSLPDGSRIGADAVTAQWLTGLRRQADAAGWYPGTPLVDAAYCPVIPLSLQARVPNTLLPGFGAQLAAPYSTAVALELDPAGHWESAWLLLPDGNLDWSPLRSFTRRDFPDDYSQVGVVLSSCRGPMSLWRPRL